MTRATIPAAVLALLLAGPLALAAPPAARPTTAPATRPATSPAADGAPLTVDALLALVPRGVLYPGGDTIPGGENPITQERLDDWLAKNMPGKRVRVLLPLLANGGVDGGRIDVECGEASVTVGPRKYAVRVQTKDARGLSVPAAAADDVLKLAPRTVVGVVGAVARVSIAPGAVTITLDGAVVELPRAKR